jgi:CxxC motif-containing protein (DUF1111 family)
MIFSTPITNGRLTVQALLSAFILLVLLVANKETLSAPMFDSGSTARGDANGDGLVNFLDITPFITALSSRPVYESQYPNLDPDVVLDMNNDGALNFLDISGFIAALSLKVQAPSNLETIPSGPANSISLTWSDSSTEEVNGYEIQYGLSAGNLTNVKEVGNVSSATISGLTAGQTWHVAVVAVASGRKSRAVDATIAAQPDAAINIVPLFNSATQLEPAITVETPAALTTYLSDRVRDRHAREGMFNAYDHYLSWYWEQRMMNVEIVDRVGRNGGTDITFNYTTQQQLNPAEFRTFFRGITTLAEYSHNQIATLVSTNPSATPGETDYNYSATISYNTQLFREIRVGDRIEIEISQFLLAPRNGRKNYYGTTLLYIVGQGLVPWAQASDLGIGGGGGNVNQSLDSYPLPENAWLGGKTTVHYQYSNEPEHAFKQTAGNLSPASGFDFMLGRRLHHTDFGDGTHSEPGNPVFAAQVGKLGSKYIARSCVECHVNNGRALPPAIGALMDSTNIKVGTNSSGSPHPVLGSVFQPKSTGGGSHDGSATISNYSTIAGQYGDGTPYTLRKPNYAFGTTTPSHYSVRLAPPLIGVGLLEAISETSVMALSDPDDSDADGISGRPQIIIDPETGQSRLGRFGYKGSHALVKHQVAEALNGDIGIATSVFPVLDDGTTAAGSTISDNELDLMTRYTALLGLQARRDLDNAQAVLGETLFASAGCAKCHTPQFTTSANHPMAEVRGQTIRPYSDLLLHDMGPGLADNMGEGIAGGSEWRTSALWNIGHTADVNEVGEAYLHDGRARTLEEAILWHGGEADASKNVFRNMSAADRAALIAFLKSL